MRRRERLGSADRNEQDLRDDAEVRGLRNGPDEAHDVGVVQLAARQKGRHSTKMCEVTRICFERGAGEVGRKWMESGYKNNAAATHAQVHKHTGGSQEGETPSYTKIRPTGLTT